MATSKIETNRDLLWTNPNPSTGLSNQTVLTAAQIQGYRAFDIEVKNYTSGNIHNVCRIGNGGTRQLWCLDSSAFGTATGAITFQNRQVTIDGNGLTFATGYAKAVNGTGAGAAATTVCLPLTIYGIK